MLRVILFALAAAVIAACSSSSYNASVFPYQINNDLLKQKPVKKVVIASANFSGEPTRFYLQKAAQRIDSKVKNYLQQNGYEVAPSYLFDNAWNQAIRTYGEMYDPTTGRVDQTTWQAVLVTTAKSLKESTDIDAIVFTDVIEHDSAHSIGLDHQAQWYGVSRKPGFSSAGQSSVPADFDWNQSVRVASLVITIYSVDLVGLFSSRGGLDTLQVIDGKMSTPSYVRRKKILDNDSNVDEGIRLAFHPFIPAKNYPVAGNHGG